MDVILDKKEELISKIMKLSAADVYTLKVFIAGMEAAKDTRGGGESQRSVASVNAGE